MGTEIFFGKPEIRLDSPVNKPPDGQITLPRREPLSCPGRGAAPLRRCAAEPGPTLLNGPRISSAPLRAAQHPRHEHSILYLRKIRNRARSGADFIQQLQT